MHACQFSLAQNAGTAPDRTLRTLNTVYTHLSHMCTHPYTHTHTRTHAHTQTHTHTHTHAFTMRTCLQVGLSSQRLLLQKRSAHKDTNPNLWDVSAAGHITGTGIYI
jgi:hypothetical protein